jgi:hypothetical protein
MIFQGKKNKVKPKIGKRVGKERGVRAVEHIGVGGRIKKKKKKKK